MSSDNSGLGYSRLKEKNFPFDEPKGGSMGNKMLYGCLCGFEKKYDPRDVPTKCPGCDSPNSLKRVEEKVAA